MRSVPLPGNEHSLLPTGMAGGLQDIRQDVFSQTNRYFGVSGLLKRSPLVTGLALGQSHFPGCIWTVLLLDSWRLQVQLPALVRLWDLHEAFLSRGSSPETPTPAGGWDRLLPWLIELIQRTEGRQAAPRLRAELDPARLPPW